MSDQGEDVDVWRAAESAAADWISAMCLSPALLVVGLSSGILLTYSLPGVILKGVACFHAQPIAIF